MKKIATELVYRSGFLDARSVIDRESCAIVVDIAGATKMLSIVIVTSLGSVSQSG